MKKQIVSFLMVLCMVCALLPTTVLAASSGTCGDGVYWMYDSGTLTISGNGKMDDYDCEWQNNRPWASYEESIESIVIGDGITYIGEQCFGGIYECAAGYDSLKTVTIGKNVAEIGNYAFASAGISSITLPDGLKKIGFGAFRETNIASVTIPQSVTSIGCNAFTTAMVNVDNENYCSVGGVLYEKTEAGLVMLSYPSAKTDKAYTIPSDCVEISEDWFWRKNPYVEELTIPGSVRSVGSIAFDFPNLKKVVFSDGIEEFAPNMNRDNSWWTDVDSYHNYGTAFYIPASVKTMNITMECDEEGGEHNHSSFYFYGDAPTLKTEYGGDAASDFNYIMQGAKFYYVEGTRGWETLKAQLTYITFATWIPEEKTEPMSEPTPQEVEYADSVDDIVSRLRIQSQLRAEEVIADAATMSVSGGAISLNSLVLSSIAEQGAAMVAAQESALGESLERSLRNTVKIITDTTDITVNVSETVLNTSADRVRIETPDYFITLNVAGMDEDFTNSDQYTVKVTEVDLDGISSASLVTEKGYSLLGVRTAEKTLNQKATRGNRGVKVEIEGGSTTNPITVGLKAESGDTTYQAIVNVDTGDATASKYNTVTEKIEGKVTQSGTYAVTENEKGFSDIAGKSAEMQEAIKYLASKGIISGTSSTTFSPDNSISRAEIAALILRALGKNSVSSYNPFSDVSGSDWYFSTACSSYKLGIINGYDDGTFRGGTAINKVQIVAVSARVLKSEMKYFDLTNSAKNKELAKFSDTIETWAQADVALASFANLVVQRSDGLFAGSSNMTRGDAAVVIYRLFEKLW